MEATTFHARVEAEVADELDDLGSRRLLAALSGGDLTRRALVAVLANSEFAARRTFEAWLDDADGRTRTTFEDLLAQERRHYERVAGLLDGHEPVDGGLLHAYLRSREAPVERTGAGLVGRPLYTLRAHEQLLDFFEGRDEQVVAVVEELHADTTLVVDRGVALLGDVCADGDDWERALAAASYAVTVAHDDYRDGLAELDG